jgi:hypothetical protein
MHPPLLWRYLIDIMEYDPLCGSLERDRYRCTMHVSVHLQIFLEQKLSIYICRPIIQKGIIRSTPV